MSIDSLSQESRVFPPPPSARQASWIKDLPSYQKMYERSLADPEGFWGEIAGEFFWHRPWSRVLSYDWKNKIEIRWFEGGQTNLCANAIDRHLPKHADRTAYLWIGNEGEEKRITYGDLARDVGRTANALKRLGVRKGDRVALYLPMIPELPVAMLACARIGAVHSVIFGGFSSDALKGRLMDSGAKILITSDGAFRGPKKIPLKEMADAALAAAAKEGHEVPTCLVVRRTKDKVPFSLGRDRWWHDVVPEESPECPAEVMDSEDPLFILYTSGSTGKPKGVLHTTAGYMIHTATTFKYVFDDRPEDLFFCTADIGWITGHSYLVYGPLCRAASMILFEGVPNHPKPDRLWEIVAKHKVTILYTAPTAIRSLMREGEEWPAKHDLSSLRVLGTVGEPINPEAWMWYHRVIGKERCPVVDTWWQTETGGILISPLPGSVPTKPGSACLPFFGVEPAVFREDGSECGVDEGGNLVIKRPWPGIMRTVYGHHERFRETYFSRYPGAYFTGDGARKDADGYYWIVGRIDDVLKVSGHRIGTAEVESALVSHPAVAEAAVVGFPHEVKGEGIHAFVVLKQGVGAIHESPLRDHVAGELGAIAKPDRVQFADALPKTRSGKIMRRILRKIAEGKPEEIGDTSTLADPSVVDALVKSHGRGGH
ncbi:MAG TPA: acetate--CoA ligase [bacterium]|nr:acetate--CoA ligase [bacterium]